MPMAEDPKEYRWSSYHAYVFGKRDILVDEHPVYEQLAANEQERRQKYRVELNRTVVNAQ